MLIVPPGSGICHQVNLEYFSKVVFEDDNTSLVYPDTVVNINLEILSSFKVIMPFINVNINMKLNKVYDLK